MNPTRNKKGDLSFTIGLILSVMLIVVIAVSCTNIFKEGISDRPGERFNELIRAVKTLEQKPAGMSDVVVGYLGERHAIVGFTSTAVSVEKYAMAGPQVPILTIPRPTECASDASCLCIIEDPEAEREPFPFTKLKWAGARCEMLTQELFNLNIIGEGEDVPLKYFFKGGFLIARAAAVASDTMTDDAVGFENIPPEPQITIEKASHGISLCLDQPCVRRGIAEAQKNFVEANARFSEAEKEYNAGNYAAAEQAFAELAKREEQEESRKYGGVLNSRERDKLYYLLAMSMVKQGKYEEVRNVLKMIEGAVVSISVKNAARATLETIDCTLRSFATCTTTEPAGICYKSVEEKECLQCTSQTGCANFDNAEACAGACGKTCTWKENECNGASV